MRRLTLGIAVSAAGHVVAMVWAPHGEVSAAVEPSHVAVEIVDILPPPPLPEPTVDPAIVDRPDDKPIVDRPTKRATVDKPAVGRPTTSITASHVDGHDLPSVDGPVAPTPSNPSMSLSMRARTGVDLRVHGEIGNGRPAGRPGERPGGAKSTVPRDDNFTISVDENGTAHVTRKPDTTVHITAPTLGEIADGFEDWWKVEKFTDQDYMTLSGDKISEKHGVHIIHFDGELNFLIPVFGGNFDLSHVIMKREGEDPYRAHKQAMLDASRDERAAALEEKHKAALASSRRTMDANLKRMWKTTSDPVARQQALLEMWDECAETGDAATIAAGTEARDAVLRFIHTHQVAFTPAEVNDFNRRRHSHDTFDPARAPADPD